MIGFVVALPDEAPNLLTQIKDVHTSIINGHDVHVLKFLNDYVCLIYSGVGKVNATMATQTLIDHFKVDTVINIGSCGAIASNVELYDIVVPNLVGYYDVDLTAFGYKLNQIPHGTDDYLINKGFHEQVVNILKLYPNHLTFGKLVSGETFVTKENISKYHIDEKAIAVDMESGAIAQTCEHNRVKYVIIKIVSDSIYKDEENAISWKNNIKLVGDLVTKIICDLAYCLIYHKHPQTPKV
ncbi:MAG: 5'-methylthioadenosine/S-adenosylhomocysteine nucleosidase [Mycoplasmataceae bacterium]|jgi:adenosylhomocysteine nucleosidase|nr:5'-methylthioadenosine/S-adenosylhomocysteine nucleosidase [Mycoplasmataceae bacterium]